MKIGVVILNYNDYKRTIECASHIVFFSCINYIVIVDNKSSNESLEKIFSFSNSINSQKLKVIQAEGNGGYAKGNNIGINYLLNETDSDIIGIVNPDVLFEDNFVERIKEQFYVHSDYAILTGLQTDKRGNISKRAFWRELNTLQFIISMSPLLSKLQELIAGNYVTKKLKTSVEKIVEVPTVEGCLFFIRASIFRKVHGFDEGTFLFMEEDILARKVKNLGWKIGIIKDISFVHDHSATIGKFISYLGRFRIMNRSRKYYFCNYLFENSELGVKFYFLLEKISWIEQIIIMLPYFLIKNMFVRK